MNAGADSRRIQRSAIRVALWVGVSSVAILGATTAITLTLIFAGSRPDRRPGRRGDRWDERVIGVGDVVPVIILLALVGVLALSLIAWYTSRRAAEPLAEALRVQRAFVADASHELRTPLTTLTSRIQLAQHRAERGGDVTSVLADLRRDATVLDDVLTDLLAAAEAAADGGGGTHAVTDVAQVAARAVDTLRPNATTAGVTIVVDAPAGLQVAADAAALARALVALLDNAVRHSPAGGSVRLTARPSGRRVQIRVTDQGDGISGIDPERLFDRFVRATEDSRGGRRGFGLGLALVRDIAGRFGGNIEVEQTSPSGTTFLLTLPIAAPPRR